MTDAERVLQIIRGFPPIRSRVPEFKRPPEFRGDGEKAFDWLVNYWMPTQQDFEVLVELTVLLGFHMGLVVASIMGEEIFLRESIKIIEKRGGKI